MIHLRCAAIGFFVVVLGGQTVDAQAPLGYREYLLGSSPEAVSAVSPTRTGHPRTVHDRPVSIVEVVWRAPYMGLGADLADPVHDLLFRFYENQLYQVIVTYDRGRMAGLTNDDVIATLAATYGVPLLRDTRGTHPVAGVDVAPHMRVIAQWDDADSLLTLARSVHSPEFQLVLVSKTLNSRARVAIAEARRLDALDAPQREMDRRAQADADAAAAGEKARTANKAAFRP
jgi:hypothetical protein